MREFKFRAWDKENKRWAVRQNSSDVLCVGKDGALVLIQYRPANGGYEPKNVELLNNAISSNLIIEQFTGKKDPSGADIWEGDIVEITDGDGWVVGNEAVELPEFYETDARCIGKRLGNIHENPELSEESK